MSNPVVHFELPGSDMERMKKFYQTAFTWEMNQMGPEMSNYVVVMTDKSDANGPLEKGRINGGLYKREGETGNDVPSVVISVSDIHQSIKDIEAAGGKVLRGPDEIPGVGTFASFTDTEGNRLSILQPVMK